MSSPQEAVAGPSDERAAASWRFENAEFNALTGQLKVAGEPVEVEPRPLQVLLELLQRAGEVVTKEELFDSVWEGRPTVDHVLANAISKLRAVLGEAAAARLVTVPRVGYRLLGPVQRVDLRAGQSLLQAGQEVPGRPGFVLLRPLGAGSRSDVWLARHAKLGHEHVFKFADDGARLTALKREYTLYRVLTQELGPRDDFASVIDTNFVAAPYFLECAYGGLSLLEWAEEADEATPGQTRLQAMNPPDRLQLFLQMARAVAAAHSVGVLHKDLKPGNILIDRVAVPAGSPAAWQARLTDFGSGRLLDRGRLEGLQLTAAGLTQTHEGLPDSRSGTLMYLAPEVLSGQSPSTQSDVYALGLILYQMLVADLRRPLATGWERDIGDELLREDIRGATEGQPAARMGSVVAFAEGIHTLPTRRLRAAAQAAERHARAIAQAEADRRRARRPWVLAAFGVLVIGLASTSVFYVRELAAHDATAVEAERAEAVINFLGKDLLAADDVARVGGRTPAKVIDLLRNASARAQDRFKSQPLTEAKVRLELGHAYVAMANLNDADKELDKALELARSGGAHDGPLLVQLLLERCLLNVEMSGPREARAAFEEAEAIGVRLKAFEGPLGLLRLRALAELLLAEGQAASAVQAAIRLVAAAQEAPGTAVEQRFEFQRLHAEALMAAGDLRAADRAIAALTAAPYSVERVGEATMARAAMRLAQLQLAAGRGGAAEPMLMEALRMLEQQPSPSQLHIAMIQMLLGQIEEQQGHWAASSAYVGKSLALFRVVLGPDHEYARLAERNLLTALLHEGRWTDAWALCGRVESWMQANAGPISQLLTGALCSRALLGLNRPGEALERLQSVSKDRPAWAPPAACDDMVALAQGFKGMALWDLGRHAEGLEWLGMAAGKFVPCGVVAPDYQESWTRYLGRAR